jgi:hypothetical protein
VPVVDQFNQPKPYDLKKPTVLCTPVNKNDVGIKTPARHLRCYQATPTKGQPQHRKGQGMQMHHQFGPEQLDTTAAAELCVASTKTLGARLSE